MSCVALAVASIAVAGDPLVTDRPDFTESAEAVAVGRVQLEAGVTFDDQGSTEAVEAGELLLRIGVARALELRLGVGSYLDVSDGGPSGLGDGSLGVKLELNEGDARGWWGRTSAAVIVATTAPSGEDELTADAWEPSVLLALGWDLANGAGLGVNLGAERPAAGGDRFTSWFASAAVGFPISGPVGGFVELRADHEERAGGADPVVGHVGLTYLLSSDLQLDVRVARRLSDDGPDLQVGGGVGWRF